MIVAKISLKKLAKQSKGFKLYYKAPKHPHETFFNIHNRTLISPRFETAFSGENVKNWFSKKLQVNQEAPQLAQSDLPIWSPC